MEAMLPWRVRFFGGLKAECGKECVTRLRTAAVTALFAFLCQTAGRSHGREELIARFWPEAEIEAGRAQLRVALTALRHAFEPPPLPPGSVIVASRTHVTLRPEAVSADITLFEQAIKRKDWPLSQALRERGEFLPGLYHEWVLAERERLEALSDEAGAASPAPEAAPLLHAPPSLPPLFRPSCAMPLLCPPPPALTRFAPWPSIWAATAPFSCWTT